MEIFSDLPLWQWLAAAGALAYVLYACVRQRLAAAKMAVIFGLIIILVLQLCKTPPVQVTGPAGTAAAVPWYTRLPLKFGLDLRGGTEMRLRLVPDSGRLERLQKDLAALRSDAASSPAAVQKLQEKVREEQAHIAENFRSAAGVIRNRLNASGLEEISVTVQGDDKLLVQIPGMGAEGAKEIVSRVQRMGQLEFRLGVDGFDREIAAAVRAAAAREDGKETAEKSAAPRDYHNFSRIENRFLASEEVETDADNIKRGPGGEELYDFLHTPEGTGLVVAQTAELDGSYIASARAQPSHAQPGQFEIAFNLTPRGAFIFQRVTTENLKRQLAIVLDGKLKSAPVIQSPIGGQGSITGNFTAAEAQSLVVVLQDALKTRVEVDFENTVGPTLGEDSIRASVIAGAVGFLGVLLFMIIYYRIAGVVANFALFINFLMIVAIMSALDATLTLPGIAGLILTIGMAVDSNVLIFERIREEQDNGMPLSRAVSIGYERAMVTIIDSNVTSFITALVLDQFGTESVRGFAKTMIIGIVCSVFTSVVLTRWCFEALLASGRLRQLKMMRFFTKASFAYSKIRRPVLLLSAVAVVIGMTFFTLRGEKNLAQDFTGGLLAQMNVTRPLSMSEARQQCSELQRETGSFSDLDIQGYGAAAGGKYTAFIVRTSGVRDNGAAADDEKKYTAAELRGFLGKHFSLPPGGLTINPERVAEKSSRETAVFHAELALNARDGKFPAAADLQTLIKENTDLRDVEVKSQEGGAEAGSGRYTLLAGVKVAGPDGTLRGDDDLALRLRDQLQTLRDRGQLDFSEPFPRFSTVGSSVADEMISSAIWALVFSLFLIFIYIWLRFQFRASFGLAAVLALTHDVLIALGILAAADALGLFNGQISLVVIAAFLTLIGYSLNDTIVIFDRIRENLRCNREQRLSTLIDASINQTLSRTIITSISTLLVVAVMFFWGGEVLRAFSFVMFTGIVVGTYSSVFVASPILIEFAAAAMKREMAAAAKKTETPPPAAAAAPLPEGGKVLDNG